MTLLHCTAKLLKELRNPPLQSPDSPNPEGLGNWYANLLRIDRRKCILFTNEKTLYSFMIPKVKKENLTNIFDEFLFNLNMNLQAEGFSREVINRVMPEYIDMSRAFGVRSLILNNRVDMMINLRRHSSFHFSYLSVAGYQVSEHPITMFTIPFPYVNLIS